MRLGTAMRDKDVSKELSAYFAAIGRKGGRIGGKRRMETLTPTRRSEIATAAARARWGTPSRRLFRSDDWPVGVRFSVWNDAGADWLGVFEITGFTKKHVLFYQPETDGANRRARKMSMEMFQRLVEEERIS